MSHQYSICYSRGKPSWTREHIKKKQNNTTKLVWQCSLFNQQHLKPAHQGQSQSQNYQALCHRLHQLLNTLESRTLLDGDRFPPKFWLMPKDWPTCKIPQGQHVARVRVFTSNIGPSYWLGHKTGSQEMQTSLLHVHSDTEKKVQAIQS